MLLFAHLNSVKFTNSATLINSRGIATRVRAVATKITKSMNNAQVKGAIIESRGKAAATAVIKAKASQAATTLKLPKEHLYWSFWLLQNYFKSLVKGYNVWFINMNKYWIFRILASAIGYIMWPIRVATQLLAYFRLARMFYVIIAFLIGLVTDINVLQNDFAGITSYLAIQLDSYIESIANKFKELSKWTREYVLDNHVQDKVGVQKAIAFPSSEQLILESADERTWLERHRWDIIIVVSLITMVSIAYYLSHTTGDLPPVTPGAVAPVAPVAPIAPAPIIPEAGQVVPSIQTNIAGAIQQAAQNPGAFVPTNAPSTWANFQNILRENQLAVRDLLTAIWEGDLSYLFDNHTQKRITEMRYAADDASPSSLVDNNLLGPNGISAISSPSSSGSSSAASSAVSSPVSDRTVIPANYPLPLVDAPENALPNAGHPSIPGSYPSLSDGSFLNESSTAANVSNLPNSEMSSNVIETNSNLNPNAIPLTTKGLFNTWNPTSNISTGGELPLNPNVFSFMSIVPNIFSKKAQTNKYHLFNIYDLCHDKTNNCYIILFYNDEKYTDNNSFFKVLWSSFTGLQLVKDISILKFKVELTNGGKDSIVLHKTFELPDNCDFSDYGYRFKHIVHDINDLSTYNYIRVYIYYNKEPRVN